MFDLDADPEHRVVVTQGNQAERIWAACGGIGGIGGIFTPTGYGTELAKGKVTRVIDGRMYVLEQPIHADLTLIKAERSDCWGNFAPVMAMAARQTAASVHEIAALGELDPESVVMPGIFVHRIVKFARRVTAAGGLRK